MPIELLIDTREAKLIPLVTQRLSGDDEHIVRVVPLEIGDVEIRHSDPDFRIIIERKSERDLGASLKDGRYHEQKARILATIPAHHCIYLIENNFRPTWASGASSACSTSAYHGAILHTMFRDGIHVAITENVRDTADWVVAIFEKCKANPSKFVDQSRNESYVSCAKIKTKKLDNVDKETCFLMQLGQIPGVSAKLAQAIAGTYPSWRRLIAAIDGAYVANGDEGVIALLSCVPLIGPKKAHVIWDYLRDSAECEEECHLSESEI